MVKVFGHRNLTRFIYFSALAGTGRLEEIA